MRLLFLFILTTLTIGGGFESKAQDSAVNIFQRTLYDRITIVSPPNAPIKKSDDFIELGISKSLSPKALETLVSNSRVLKSVDYNAGQLSLHLNTAVTDTRHFRIGNKIVLDIFYDNDKLAELSRNQNPADIKVADAIEAPNQNTNELAEEPPVINEQPSDNIEKTITKTIKKEPIEIVEDPAPVLPIAQTLPELADATIITISSTTAFGLSVFERFGRLFILTDQETMAIPPQIAGAGRDLGWAIEQVPMDNGKAWVMNLPQGAFVRPEGHSLLWRLIISDQNPNLTTADIRHRNINPEDKKIDLMMSQSSKLLRFTDPLYKDDLAVITVKKSSSRVFQPFNYVDFDVLPAIVGAVVKPETDGLRIVSSSQFVTISNRNNLVIDQKSQDEIVLSYLRSQNVSGNAPKTIADNTNLERVYYFSDWGGGIKPTDFIDKRQELSAAVANAPKDRKLNPILDLAKLALSQNLGQEAMGYLDLAGEINSQIDQISEYKALRGAAHFLAGQYDVALKHLSDDSLSLIDEINLWQSAAFAAQDNEEKAVETYQDNAALAAVYPYHVRYSVLAPLALALINQGQASQTMNIIEMLSDNIDNRSQEERATVAYLKGLMQSFTGRPDEGIANLYKASMSDKLGPYGIRSELLLIQDELDREVIDNDEAIKRMERLRFAWRGDTLETDIQKALGELYIRNEAPRRGLTILKRATGNTRDIEDRREIVRLMADAYKSIFIGKKFEETDPMVAVTVYDEFKELTPIGAEGNEIIDRLADKLMSVNLMSRATNVLNDKMNRLGEGEHAIQTGLRIARIQLIDREPKAALETLDQVNRMIAAYKGDAIADVNEKIVLLRAKALADTGEPQQALFMTEGLDDTDDVIRLRIDTAWRTGKWVAVTDNLSKLLARENITPASPPSAEQTQLILNQAVALSLSDQYDALQRFAARYDTAMKQTPVYRTFQVVTRPQNISSLADRETLLDVASEVDLFEGVLENGLE
jgi:tetratricopeptide (TPR) repeat protein